MNVVNQFTKIIFPFRYEKKTVMPSLATVKNKSGDSVPLFEATSIGATNLRSGLDLLLDKNGGSANICECYRLDPNRRKHFDLPPHITEAIPFEPRQEKRAFNVAITDVRIFLFESLVGAVEVEFAYPDCTIDDFVILNYYLAEAKSKANVFTYTPEDWDPVAKKKVKKEDEKKTFTIADILSKISDCVCVGDNKLEYTYYDAKPLAYSHLLLPERPLDFDSLIYHASKNYNDSYKYADNSGTKVYTPFENSVWGATMNGAVNISCITGDPKTDAFFSDEFIPKLHSTYYYLFINAVHQRLLLERIMANMGELDYLGKNYERMKEQLKAAKACNEEAARLKFRAFFDLPSTIDHVNSYYDNVREAFGITRLCENFDRDISNLSAICNSYVDRIKERDKKISDIRKAKAEIFVSVFGTVVGEVALLNSSWELLEKLLGREVGLFSVQMIAVLGALVVPIVTVIVNTFYQIKAIKKMEREVADERRERLVEDDKIRRIRARIKKKRKKN